MTINEIIRLAASCNLGQAMKPIGMDTGDVFHTDSAYRTTELLKFADAIARRALAESELATLHGERATLADWIAEALSVLEKDAEGDDAKRLLIEQGNALVVAVRGGER